MRQWFCTKYVNEIIRGEESLMGGHSVSYSGEKLKKNMFKFSQNKPRSY